MERRSKVTPAAATKTRLRKIRLAPEHFERVDRTHLQKGLEFYEKLVQTNQASILLQGETERAYLRAGRIQMILGQNDKAEVAFHKAIAILEKVDEGSLQGPDARRALMDAYRSLGQMLRVPAAFRRRRLSSVWTWRPRRSW
jgi:tetratricopeptide (TPR) repeat protein